MKKIILNLLFILPITVFSQTNQGFSLMVAVPKLGAGVEYKNDKWGVGVELISDKVEYDKNFFKMVKGDYNQKIFNNKRFSYGFYGISPSYKGFDIILGGGLISYSIYDSWIEGDRVSGYYRSNGTYVNSYIRNERNVSGYVKVDETFYGISGIGYQLPLSGDYITLQFRGVIRYIPKYGNEELGREISPNLMMGIKIKI